MIKVKTCYLSLSLVAILFVGSLACGTESNGLCQGVVFRNNICEKPKKFQTQKEQSCQIDWAANQCDKLIKENPQLVMRDKVKSCDSAVTCEKPKGVFDYLKTCKQSMGDAVSDLGAFAIGVITGTVMVPTEEQLLKQKFFKDCESADCKRNMLGKFASLPYFTEEEISGHKEKISAGDIASQNYNEGYSAAVLYRKLLLKLKSDLKNKGMTEKFMKPWNHEEAQLPRSFDEMINDALDKAGIQNTACLKPEVVAELNCYAATMLIVPSAGGIALSSALRNFLGLSAQADVAGVGARRSLNLKPGKANAVNGKMASKVAAQENSINAKMWELRDGMEDGSLSHAEMEKKATEISEELVQSLKDQGYGAKVTKIPQGEGYDDIVGVEVESFPNTPGGKTLASAQEKLGVKYYLSPLHQAVAPGTLGSHAGGAVFLPVESVTTKSLGADLTTVHEVRHAMFAKKLAAGKNTPYYGLVEVLDPTGVMEGGGLYDSYMSFEELSTFHRGMRQSQQSSARPFPSSMFVPIDKNLDKVQAAELEHMSYAVRDTVKATRKAVLEPPDAGFFGKPENLRFYRDPANNQVAVEIVKQNYSGTPISKTTYWLVDAKDPTSYEKNRQILLKYLDQVESAANSHLKAAQEVLGR
jgi:hypothetical protein